LELNPNEQEKKDLVAFMRARQASDSGLNGGHDRSPGVPVYTPHSSPFTPHRIYALLGGAHGSRESALRLGGTPPR